MPLDSNSIRKQETPTPAPATTEPNVKAQHAAPPDTAATPGPGDLPVPPESVVPLARTGPPKYRVTVTLQGSEPRIIDNAEAQTFEAMMLSYARDMVVNEGKGVSEIHAILQP